MDSSSLTLQHLPSEVIVNCFSFLNVKDIKSCRLVSKQFNNYILESPQIMRKFKFNLQFSIKPSDINESQDLDESVDLNSSIESDTELQMFGWEDSNPQNVEDIPTFVEDPEILLELWEFVDSKGMSIRRAELKLNRSDKFSWNILEQLPNLEELTMNEKLLEVEAVSTAGKTINNLQRLRILSINLDLLKTFITSTKNVTKLEKLTVFVSTEDHQDILTNFIAQQKNLKELNIEFDPELATINFPASNLISKRKFQLTKFKFYKGMIHNQSQHFNKFIESQSQHLEKLKLDFRPDDQLCDIIIKKCRNLKKLEISVDSSDLLFTNVNEIWKLPALTTFKCDVMENPSFQSIITRLPNVTKLKSGRLGLFEGTYDKVTEIKTELFMCHKYDCQFPKLKTLHIKNLLGMNVDDWMAFSLKHKNLENLSIIGTFFCDGPHFGLEHFKHFDNLKTLKFRGIDVDCRMLRDAAVLMANGKLISPLNLVHV